MTSIHELEAEPFELEPETAREPAAAGETYDELELDEFEADRFEELELEEAEAAPRGGGVVEQRHSDLGHVWSVPRAQVPSVMRELQEEIIPPDQRVPVKDTTAVPYRWICRLDLNFGPNPASPGADLLAIGTGVLVSPRHVLTVGHNLRNILAGATRDVRAARVVPGYNCLTKNGEPLGAARAVRFRVHDRWRDHRDRQFDYGLITLGAPIGDSTPAALGGRPLGYWGSPTAGAGTRINPTDPARLRGLTVNVSGYPIDFCCMRRVAAGTCAWDRRATAQFRAHGRVTDPAPAVAPRLVFYDADTVHGHSGSPVWVVYKEFRNLVALHTGQASTFDPALAGVANRGLRITAEVMTQVRRWMGG